MTHKQQYPLQYSHPLVGKTVRVKDSGFTFVVERVVNSYRWGAMVHRTWKEAYSISDLEQA